MCLSRKESRGSSTTRKNRCDIISEKAANSTLGSLIQLIKFCIIGASNTIVSLAVYYIFVLIDLRLYLIGNVAGFIISVLNAYYWNNRYVFKDKNRNHLVALLKTYLIYGTTTVLSTVLLYIFVEWYGISEFIAPLITTAITIIPNFLLSKYWAYKTRSIQE